MEVVSVDRAGNFQGTLRIGKVNLGGEVFSLKWGGAGDPGCTLDWAW